LKTYDVAVEVLNKIVGPWSRFDETGQRVIDHDRFAQR
jgi:hypothetical protein